MVLESIFSVKDLHRSQLLLLLFTAIVAIISSITAYFFFENCASVLVVGFITIAFTHFIHRTYQIAENNIIRGGHFFQRYGLVIKSYLKIFLALTIVFALMYALLPQDNREVMFAEQIETLHGVSDLRDNIVESSGNFHVTMPTSPAELTGFILLNNLEVLFAILLLSFIYGAGAIFLIAYQSSILGAIIGENIINLFGHYNNLGIYGNVFAILHGSYLSLGVLPHGVFEIGAYFLGAIAGGIISASLVGHYSQTRKILLRTIRDVAILFGLAILFLVIGAIIETNLILV